MIIEHCRAAFSLPSTRISQWTLSMFPETTRSMPYPYVELMGWYSHAIKCELKHIIALSCPLDWFFSSLPCCDGKEWLVYIHQPFGSKVITAFIKLALPFWICVCMQYRCCATCVQIAIRHGSVCSSNVKMGDLLDGSLTNSYSTKIFQDCSKLISKSTVSLWHDHRFFMKYVSISMSRDWSAISKRTKSMVMGLLDRNWCTMDTRIASSLA